LTTIDATATHDFDTAIRPQDDLFGHVNGQWAKTVEIPEDKSSYGSFNKLADESEANVRKIIEECAASDAAAGSDEQKIGDLFRSFMDAESIEAAGAAPLKPVLERIDQVTDKDSLVTLLGEHLTNGIGGPFGLYVAVDRGNPTAYVMHLFQAGLGLPDESFYRLPEHEELRAKYLAFMTKMLELAGIGGAAEAEQVFGFETTLAASHWDRTATRDAMKTYNPKTADELAALLPVAPQLFTAGGIAEDAWSHTLVMTPDIFEAVTRLLDEVDVETWKQWCRWKAVTSYASYLSEEFVNTSFDFYGRTLSGTPELKERWKRGVGLVEGVLGEAIGRIYVGQHYSERAEQEMTVLVDNLIDAYRERISTLEWMADETRERALAKLAAFTPKIGKPIKWRDYSALEIKADDLIGNLQRAEVFTLAWNLDKLSGPVDRDEWLMTPQTVNAYYYPPMNEIVFPAAILQPPFFDADIDPAYNYGAIGAVIGHEIGHGFDDQGSKYDGDGTLRDWWTESDRERFDVKVKALIEQYSAFTPRALGEEHKVNGALTVGENIGDLGGVAVAHHAYRLSLKGEEAPVIDGLTGDQRFFIGWALAWRVAMREPEAIQRLTTDPHSPAEFRTHVVRNIDAFHEAFDTKPGDGLWLDPDKRVAIW
jgi:putative endopeptidase